MGSPALTSRGFIEKDFEQVAEFVDRAVNIAAELKKKTGPKLKDFRDYLNKEVRRGRVALYTAFHSGRMRASDVTSPQPGCYH